MSLVLFIFVSLLPNVVNRHYEDAASQPMLYSRVQRCPEWNGAGKIQPAGGRMAWVA